MTPPPGAGPAPVDAPGSTDLTRTPRRRPAAASQVSVVSSDDYRNLDSATSAGGASAKVLVFGSEKVTDTSTGATARSALVTLTATLQHRGDRCLISGLDVGANPGLAPGSAELAQAVEAGRSEVVNVLTNRRSRFAADHQAALDGAVTALAIQSADGDRVTLLVAATGTRVQADGASTVVDDGRYTVSVVKVQGFCVTSDIAPVVAG